ncbi:MAG: hypothetical protein ABIQ31_17805 [Ferruginibacter sp.]
MKREKLLNSKTYWMTMIQNDLFGAINNYLKKNKINKTQLAGQLNVSKGYLSQVMNGNFDHKISKVVDLALACDTVPILTFISKEDFIEMDLKGWTYDMVPTPKVKSIFPAFNTNPYVSNLSIQPDNSWDAQSHFVDLQNG